MDVVLKIIQKLVGCLWPPISEEFSYLRSLDKNVEILEGKMEELVATERDVQDKLDIGKATHSKKPNNVVQLWLKKVGEVTNTFGSIQHELEDDKKCLSGCLPNYCVHIKLSKLAAVTIPKINELAKEGKELNDLFANPKPAAGLIRSTTTLVGKTTAEMTLERVWESVMDTETRIIGLWGMGGTGKTTIMKKINDRLVEEGNLWDIIIWATVSKNLNLEKLQNNIAKILEIDFSKIEEETERVGRLLQRLNEVKFVLILDDVWEHVPLGEVGIPSPSRKNGCKLLLTSRKSNVCDQMNCQKSIKMETLSEEEAWELFKQNVGNDVAFTPEVEKTATNVARECACLPLAIITVGKAMRKKTDVRAWRIALYELRNSIDNDMNDEVLAQLKFSFDCLSNDMVRECFLYCALYPEDDVIPCQELVNYWIAEGLIDDYKDWEIKMDKGYAVLEELKNSCMLENVEEDKYVKMHDLIRDMAINITSQSNRFIVNAGVGLTGSLEKEKWTESVERISLIRNQIDALPDQPNCPKLSTLLLQGNPLSCNISHSFFEQMHNLRVLNLSNTRIEYLPESLSGLKQLCALLLEGCWKLKQIPSLSSLTELRLLKLREARIEALPHGSMNGAVNLSHIDLSHTRIEYLPESLSCLENLRELLLEGCDNINTLPSLSRLIELRVLDLRRSSIEALPESLSDLVNLRELLLARCGNIKTLPSLSRLTKLRVLDLSESNIEALPESLSDLVNLQKLVLDWCRNLKEIPSLSRLTELKVLTLNETKIEALPQGIEGAVNLTDIDLSYSRIKTLPSLSRLTELRELNLKMSRIEALPEGLKGAVNLRYINLECTWNLQLFPAGILPNLTHLEGLLMIESGWKWRESSLGGGAGIEDIISLSHLGRLEIEVEDLQGWTPYFTSEKWKSLKCFRFNIGNGAAGQVIGSDRQINIEGCDFVNQERSGMFPDNTESLYMGDCIGWVSLFSNFKDLMRLEIERCHEMKTIFPLGLFQHLSNLRMIIIRNCEEIEEIAGGEAGEEGEIRAEASNSAITLLPQLYHLELIDLPKLRRVCKRELVCESLAFIEVKNCPLLEKPPFSVDNIPPDLREIDVRNCEEIGEIAAGEEGEIIAEASNSPITLLPELRRLLLKDLPKLRRVCKRELACKSLEYIQVDNCPLLKKLPFSLDSIPPSLRKIEVRGCHAMKTVFPFGLFQHLSNLIEIEVSYCEEIEEIEAGEGEIIVEASNSAITLLPELRRLDLKKLPKLKRVWKREHVCKSVEVIRVRNCPLLKKLPFSVDNIPPYLAYIEVKNCPLLKKLPFSVDNIPPSLGKIVGEKKWWDALEWDDPETKILLQPCFQRCEADKEE